MNREELLNKIWKIICKVEKTQWSESIFATPFPSINIPFEKTIDTILEEFGITQDEYVEYRDKKELMGDE